MDRSLDEIINSRDGPRGRGKRPNVDNNHNNGAPRRDGRAPRREDFPRDGVRKSYRENGRDIDRDWVHDKFEDEDAGRPARRSRNDLYARHSHSPGRETAASKTIRADNLHYDLTENDLHDLFSRIGAVQSIRLLYDRADRSQGIAFVTYNHADDARDAMREYDGANAMGQPIRLSLQNAASARPARNPFDNVEKPSRSLFERIGGNDRRGGRRGRSASPRRAPENIDRYTPGNRGRASRSPRGRHGGARESGRAPGVRREERGGGARRGGRGGKETEGRAVVQGRPRKTAEELDAEMDSYWGTSAGDGQAAQSSGQDNAGREAQVATAPRTENPATGTTSAMDDDIDLMVE